jgi:hypothetical protein
MVIVLGVWMAMWRNHSSTKGNNDILSSNNQNSNHDEHILIDC